MVRQSSRIRTINCKPCLPSLAHVMKLCRTLKNPTSQTRIGGIIIHLLITCKLTYKQSRKVSQPVLLLSLNLQLQLQLQLQLLMFARSPIRFNYQVRFSWRRMSYSVSGVKIALKGILQSDNGDVHEIVFRKTDFASFQTVSRLSTVAQILKRREYMLDVKKGGRVRIRAGMVEFIALSFPVSSKINFWPFHVVVVQGRQRNWWCTCRVVVLLIKSIAALTFPLPLPSYFRNSRRNWSLITLQRSSAYQQRSIGVSFICRRFICKP